MTQHYRDILFSPAVRAAQEAQGVRLSAADAPGRGPDRLSEDEIGFIAARDSFYMATTGAGGWPYMQHRGGPRGFVVALSDRQIGFADFRGNRQYLSLGNLSADDRAAFFFMDYANRARLKLLGRVRAVPAADDPGLIARLEAPGYKARVERAILVDVEAFDWNCAQHITQRFTPGEIAAAVLPLHRRITDLEAELARLTGAAALR